MNRQGFLFMEELSNPKEQKAEYEPVGNGTNSDQLYQCDFELHYKSILRVNGQKYWRLIKKYWRLLHVL